MSPENSITLTRKKSIFPFNRIYEIYIDDQYKGRILNGEAKRIPVTKDSVFLQIKDTGRWGWLPFKTSTIKIPSSEAQEFNYKIQSGIRDGVFFCMIAMIIIGILGIELMHYIIFTVLILLPILYYIGFRFLNKNHFLYITKESLTIPS